MKAMNGWECQTCATINAWDRITCWSCGEKIPAYIDRTEDE